MLEKEPSGASPERTQPPQSAGVTPGGSSPQGQPPLDMVLDQSSQSHQHTLQFLIAVIKKTSSSSASNNTERA